MKSIPIVMMKAAEDDIKSTVRNFFPKRERFLRSTSSLIRKAKKNDLDSVDLVNRLEGLGKKITDKDWAGINSLGDLKRHMKGNNT